VPSFLSELTVTQLSSKPGVWRLWKLENDLIYEVEATRRITVPDGFITDGPSVPRLFWVFLPIWGSWSRAGVVHDWLCCLIALGYPDRGAPTRTDADKIFLQAMQVSGVGWFTRTQLYVGVRIGTILRIKTTMVNYNGKKRAAESALSS